MPSFSERSRKNLETCDERLQRLFTEVVKHYDCSILEGYRSQQDQDRAFQQGRSQLRYPQSSHNKNPSMAVDVAPYPIDWRDLKRWYHFGGYVLGIAEIMQIKIRWGGDWNRNMDLKDQNFMDFPHFELVDV